MDMCQDTKLYRDTSVCQLIRCALGTSRFTTFVFSFGARDDDNENIAHLACKIARTRAKASVGHGRKTISVSCNVRRSGDRRKLSTAKIKFK